MNGWYEAAITGIITIISGIVGFIVKGLVQRVDQIELDMKELPNIYARRDEAQRQFDLIISSLRRIEDKLDDKMDKPK